MTDQEKSKIVRVFIDTAHHIVFYQDTFDTLFDASNQKILSETAGVFFGQVNQLFQNYIILEIVKLLDPAGKKGSRNLTVQYICETLLDVSDKNLLELAGKLQGFRPHISAARNKIIGHNDLRTFMRSKTLSVFKEEDLRLFYQNLKEFLDGLSNKFFGNIVGELVTGELRDEGDLINSLKKVSAFQKMFEKADTEMKM